MKKKIFLVSLISILCVLLLAISASAVTGSTSNEYGTVTYVDGISEVSGYDTTSRAVLKNADGTYTTYPAYYVYNGSTGTNMKVDLTKLKNATGEEYSKSSLIRIEVFANSRLNWTFEDCSSLIDVYLPEGTFLHYASFIGCSALETIDLPNTGVTQIPTDCFSGCTSLKSIEIPSTVTSLGARAFQNCNSLSLIKIPEGATGVIPQDFRKITSGTSTPVTYIVPKDCAGVNSQYSINNCNVEKIIFTGNSDSAFIADITADVSWALSIVVYENHCDHYYDGVHEEDNNPCIINCARCNAQGVAEKNPIHDELVVITYTSYTVAGTRVVDCQNDGCGYHIDGTANPLFVCNGYSIPDDERIGIAVSYKVDKNAVAEYKALNNDFEYGVFAVLESKIGTNDIIKQDGTLTTSSVCANLTGEALTAVTLKIVGFTTESDKALSLAMGIYVKKAEEGQSKYTYIQVASPEEGQKYSFISYNGIL